jgi:hypothetical protein
MCRRPGLRHDRTLTQRSVFATSAEGPSPQGDRASTFAWTCDGSLAIRWATSSWHWLRRGRGYRPRFRRHHDVEREAERGGEPGEAPVAAVAHHGGEPRELSEPIPRELSEPIPRELSEPIPRQLPADLHVVGAGRIDPSGCSRAA